MKLKTPLRQKTKKGEFCEETLQFVLLAFKRKTKYGTNKGANRKDKADY